MKYRYPYDVIQSGNTFILCSNLKAGADLFYIQDVTGAY